jgi:hypothetical protein
MISLRAVLAMVMACGLLAARLEAQPAARVYTIGVLSAAAGPSPTYIIGGDLPQRQRRFVEAWAEIHQVELLAAWDGLQAGRPRGKIEPLR